MNCKKCAKEVPEGSVFCPFCGERADGNKPCPACGALMGEEYVFCPKCGARADGKPVCPVCGTVAEKDARFCLKCGCALQSRGGKVRAVSSAPFSRVASPVYPVRPDPVRTAPRSPAAGILPPPDYALPSVRPPRPRKPKDPDRKVRFAKWYALGERIVFALLTGIFFLCSFFGVVRMDATEMMDMVSGNLTIEGKVYAEVDAIDLIDVAFYSMGSRKTSEYEKYLNKVAPKLGLDLQKALAKSGSVELDQTSGTVITGSGCRRVNAVFAKYNILKIGYATTAAEDEPSEFGMLYVPQSMMLQIQIAGFGALALIILSFVAFALAIARIFIPRDFASFGLIAGVFGLTVGISAMFIGSSIEGVGAVGMGAAYISVIVFSCLFFVYRTARVLITANPGLGIRDYVVRGGVVAAGILLICSFAMGSAYRLVGTYEGAQTEVTCEFTADYGVMEGFDVYYPVFDTVNGTLSRPLTGEIKTSFDRFALENGQSMFADLRFKGLMGIPTVINSKEYYEQCGALRALYMIQPFMALLSVSAAIWLMLEGLRAFTKPGYRKKNAVIAASVFLFASVYSLAMPLALSSSIAMYDALPVLSVEVGAASIVQVVFGVLAVVGAAVASVVLNARDRRTAYAAAAAGYPGGDGQPADGACAPVCDRAAETAAPGQESAAAETPAPLSAAEERPAPPAEGEKSE